MCVKYKNKYILVQPSLALILGVGVQKLIIHLPTPVKLSYMILSVVDLGLRKAFEKYYEFKNLVLYYIDFPGGRV